MTTVIVNFRTYFFYIQICTKIRHGQGAINSPQWSFVLHDQLFNYLYYSWTVFHAKYLLARILRCSLINNCCVFIIRAFPVWNRGEKTLKGWLWSERSVSGCIRLCMCVACKKWQALHQMDDLSLMNNRWLRHVSCTCGVGPKLSLFGPTADLNATQWSIQLFLLLLKYHIMRN